MVANLLKLMPLKHLEYVEVFGGGASLLFAKKPSSLEVYNDLDQGLVNFFRVLRDPETFARFRDVVSLTPYSRQEHIEARAWMAEEDPVERARKWFILARQSFGGNFYGNSWGFSVSGAGASIAGNWVSAQGLLPAVHRRLQHVQIENVDWRRCLEIYNLPTTLIYCDPPYLPETRKAGGYEHELTREDHEDLLVALNNFPGMVMLSGYDNDLYRTLEESPGAWTRTEFETSCMVAGRTRVSNLQGKGAGKANAPRTEVVWRNPAAVLAAGAADQGAMLAKDLDFSGTIIPLGDSRNDEGNPRE